MTQLFGHAVGERRCHAHKKNGDQCGKWGIRGTEPPVCRSHGGAIPQVRAAAAARLEVRKTREVAARVVVDPMRFATPADAAGFALSQVAQRAAQFAQVADQLDSATYTGRDGRERVRAAVTEQRLWLDSMSRMLSVAVSAATAAGTSEPSVSPVEVFTFTVSLLMEDVQRAMINLHVEDGQREKIMDEVLALTRLRLKQSSGMIIEQVRMMAEAAR